MEEHIALLDKNGKPAGSCKRREKRPSGCYCHIAATLILNSAGNLILQQRSAHKSKYPLCWSYSSGGHVNAKETTQIAALRELKEEMRIDVSQAIFIGQTQHKENNILKAFHSAFLVHHDGPYYPDPQEAAQIKEFSISQLKEMIQSNPTQFHPCFIDLFNLFVQKCL